MNSHSRKSYKKFIIWQKAHKFAQEIYKIQKNFPRNEDYGISSQLRRAALSVPTNIVEGSTRTSKKEFKHFLGISISSLAEAEYLIEFSKDLDYISESEYNHLENIRHEVGATLWKFRQSL